MQKCSCKGSWPSGVHGLGEVMESTWVWDGEVWTTCGHTLSSDTILDLILCMTSHLNITCVLLEWNTSLV